MVRVSNSIFPPFRPLLKHLSILIAAFAVIAAAGITAASAAPRADLWPRWQAHDAASTEVIEHSVWTRLLQTYGAEGEDGIVLIGYGRFSDADKQALKDYIERLSGVAQTEGIAAIQIDFDALTSQRAFYRELIRRLRPNVALGMGGFAAGPGGFAAWLLRKPLVIHEQNSVAG